MVHLEDLDRLVRIRTWDASLDDVYDLVDARLQVVDEKS